MSVESFLIERQEKIEDIASDIIVYIHKKTNAKVLHIANADDNKLFSIAFNTPTKDNSGVFHIIEHSVLSGSRKYRSKDPFIDFYKSSLATFMNAMTLPDITMYPFSTRNEKDFFNLMDMYLDSVFFPRMYEEPEIFYKEGWHYDIDSKEDELKYNGVVYNEMRGLLSNRMANLSYFASSVHYMNHCYSFNAGGDPQEIPHLTYEAFIEAHKKYYHPSNAFVVLYGDMDIEKSLNLLDAEYFSKFERKNLYITTERLVSKKKGKDDEYSGIDKLMKNYLLQNVSVRIKGVNREGEYSISKDDTESKSLLALGFKIDTDTDLMSFFVTSVLVDCLFSSPSSPVRLKVLQKQLAKDMSVQTMQRCRNDFFIYFEDIEKENKDAISSLVQSVLEEISEKGIDKELLEGAIQGLEFEWKEANVANSHGLFYLFKACEYWFYGEDIFEVLNISKIIKQLRTWAEGHFFEDFIKQYFLSTGFKSYALLNPKRGKNEEDDKKTAEELKSLKKALSEEQLASIIKINDELKARIERENAEDEGKNISHLSFSDVRADIWNCYYEKEERDCTTILHVPIPTSDLLYFDFAFDINGIDATELPLISFLTDLLTQVDTKKHSYKDLNKEFALNTGGSSFFPEVIENKKTHKITLRIVWNIKALSSKIDKMFALMDEVSHLSVFENDLRIQEVLNSTILRMESGFLYRGDSVVRSRICSYLLEGSKLASLLGGFDYFHFLKDLNLNFSKRIESIKKQLAQLYEHLFRRDNLVISISSSKKDFDAISEKLDSFIKTFPKNPIKESTKIGNLCKIREGILAESDVLYVGKGYDIEKFSSKYSGKLLVLCNILNSGYLFNNIRAKGGAYGASIGVYSNRALIASSYRDPSLKETLQVYDEVSKFLEKFSVNPEQMQAFIIGSLKEFYTPIFPESEAIRALRLFLSGRENSDIVQTIEEALSTSLADIKEYATLTDKVFGENCICVFGNEQKIKENESLFEHLIRL